MCHIREQLKLLVKKKKCHNLISKMYRKCDSFHILLLLYALVL